MYKYLFLAFSSSGYIFRPGMLDLLAILCLVFETLLCCLPQWLPCFAVLHCNLQQCTGHHCLHILVNPCYFLLLIAFLMGVKRHHSLMISHVEHLFTRLLGTHIVLGEVSVWFLIFFYEIFLLISHSNPPPPSFIYLFIIWLSCIFGAVCKLALTVVSRGCSSWGCAGFSLRWLLLLRPWTLERVSFRRRGTWACGFFLDQVEPMSLELAGGFLNHWPTRKVLDQFLIGFCLFFFFNFIFKLYIIVLVLPNIKMNPPQVYMCSPSWTLLPPGFCCKSS